jgi:hypothetical protein
MPGPGPARLWREREGRAFAAFVRPPGLYLGTVTRPDPASGGGVMGEPGERIDGGVG